MSAMEERAKLRGNWQVRKFPNLEEMRRQQIRDWQRMSGEDRRLAAWELARDYWLNVKKLTENELRLQRSVGHSRKGGS